MAVGLAWVFLRPTKSPPELRIVRPRMRPGTARLACLDLLAIALRCPAQVRRNRVMELDRPPAEATGRLEHSRVMRDSARSTSSDRRSRSRRGHRPRRHAAWTSRSTCRGPAGPRQCPARQRPVSCTRPPGSGTRSAAQSHAINPWHRSAPSPGPTGSWSSKIRAVGRRHRNHTHDSSRRCASAEDQPCVWSLRSECRPRIPGAWRVAVRSIRSRWVINPRWPSCGSRCPGSPRTRADKLGYLLAAGGWRARVLLATVPRNATGWNARRPNFPGGSTRRGGRHGSAGQRRERSPPRPGTDEPAVAGHPKQHWGLTAVAAPVPPSRRSEALKRVGDNERPIRRPAGMMT
jgi:hypothetical protein